MNFSCFNNSSEACTKKTSKSEEKHGRFKILRLKSKLDFKSPIAFKYELKTKVVLIVENFEQKQFNTAFMTQYFKLADLEATS